MKKAIALLSLTALASLSLAQTRLICRMASPSIPWMRVTAAKYGLAFLDLGYSSPFALYQTVKGQDPVAIQNAIIGFRHWSQSIWWVTFVLITILATRLVRQRATPARG